MPAFNLRTVRKIKPASPPVRQGPVYMEAKLGDRFYAYSLPSTKPVQYLKTERGAVNMLTGYYRRFKPTERIFWGVA